MLVFHARTPGRERRQESVFGFCQLKQWERRLGIRGTGPAGPVQLLLGALGVLSLATIIGASAAQAQVPAKIEAQLQKMGHIVDPACTARLYRSMMPKNDITSGVKQPYPGIAVTRNVSFGPDPKDAVDIFEANKGANSHAVLIYVPGGAGNKIEIQDKAANAFYDNIGRWATRNGMVAVLMQRHRGTQWDSGGKDIAMMIQWLQDNVAKYHGDAGHMFIWAHSAGNGPLGTYIGHPDLWGPKGVGVKGAIFMSGHFNIAPSQPPATSADAQGATFGDAGKLCGAGGPGSTAGALPGVQPGYPGGPEPALAGGPGPRGPRPQMDEKTMLAQSNLPGIEKADIKIMLAAAELDPEDRIVFNKTLSDGLCGMGLSHCPVMLFAKGESHMSEVFSIDTPDRTVSGPVLKFIRSVK